MGIWKILIYFNFNRRDCLYKKNVSVILDIMYTRVGTYLLKIFVKKILVFEWKRMILMTVLIWVRIIILKFDVFFLLEESEKHKISPLDLD